MIAASIYVLAILPAGSLITVLSANARDARQLSALNRKLSSLKHRVSQLNNPSYIDQIARNQYGMYPKGSVPYQILPSSPMYSAPARARNKTPAGG